MSKVLYHDKWMDLCANEDGESFIRMQDGVLMIPVTQDHEFMLIEEQSIAYGNTMLTLPTGGINADETPKAAANRELQEEIGYQSARLDLIGMLHPTLKYARWRYWVVLARELSPHKLEGDEKTSIGVKRIRPSEVSWLIDTGKLKDSTTIAALFMALNHVKMGTV